MSFNIVYPHGQAVSVAVAASDKVAVKTKGVAKVYQIVSPVDMPEKRSLLQTVTNDEWVSSAFSAAATLEIEAAEAEVHYVVGTDVQVQDEGNSRTNYSVGALNATGSLTAALTLGGVVTSTTAAAVTATLDTGTLMDAGSEFDIGEGYEWSVINTGGSNAFTVTAATGHTIVGAGAVANSTSGRFMTLKTAANTFVTYRLS